MGLPPSQSIDRPSSVGSTLSTHRYVVIAALAFVWLRVGFIMSVAPFETPDTASYRSGQATRPPLSSALLSNLGDTTYVAMSALVSSLGVIALAWALWNPHRRHWSIPMIAALGAVSFLPMVATYEHWLVPDSLLIGLALIALALASRRVDAAWYPWAVIAVCTLITLTKEVGFGVVVLVALVLAVRQSYRVALITVLTSVVLFATVVLPGSGREGRVVWDQPIDTELTMARYRVIMAGLMWPDLSPALGEVNQRAATCGMNREQLIAETLGLTDEWVDYADCPDLLRFVDGVSQPDLLESHLRNPVHVAGSIERGFVPNMHAMSHWSGFSIDQPTAMTLDRVAAGAVAMLPFIAMVVALLRRRGRRLALIATLGSAMALVVALLDPSSQDRHTLVFRVAAFAVALLAVTEATDRSGDQRDHDEADTADDGPTIGDEERPADVVDAVLI